ncbi:hypothetical protein IGI04_002082 [Brassica rapa subsp. trilocularis]|uniref:Nucleoplasmin-like domain-containing protein n=1 Tax=Brassica rapa subsp. trilocularis TaxID=1813537 RepID=A0ABQ7NUH9_BRACM|nr:hypothetical protein IGI04_002082 [Brassica rapa subsp. trilocularis]
MDEEVEIGSGTDGCAVPSTVQGESRRVTSPGRRGLTARTGWQELERNNIFALEQKDTQTCEDTHWPITHYRVEVQAGKPLKVTPGYDSIVHISHASLGDYKGKKGEAVTFNVKVGDKKFVMGTFVSESIPQTCFDMLFDQEFELSHNWGKGKEEEEVEVPATVAANGNAAKSIAKPKHVTAPVKRNADPEADDSDSEGVNG